MFKEVKKSGLPIDYTALAKMSGVNVSTCQRAFTSTKNPKESTVLRLETALKQYLADFSEKLRNQLEIVNNLKSLEAWKI